LKTHISHIWIQQYMYLWSWRYQLPVDYQYLHSKPQNITRQKTVIFQDFKVKRYMAPVQHNYLLKQYYNNNSNNNNNNNNNKQLCWTGAIYHFYLTEKHNGMEHIIFQDFVSLPSVLVCNKIKYCNSPKHLYLSL
jgi:hypothetical protein